MDKVLILSILLVFLGALVGSVMQHRRLDRVLEDLRGFQVTLRMGDKRIWGNFKLFSNALELIYSRPYFNRRGNQLTSFIVFAEQMGDIDTILRFHDELTPENQQRRLKEIEKAKHPGLFSRLQRGIRNFMVAFREAIDESIGLLMSRVQKKASTSMLKGQGDYLKKLGSSTVGMVSTAAYDPVLEYYINHRVVFEAGKVDGQRVEYVGVLKEYSTNWVSLLDCHLNTENKLPLSDANLLMLQRKMDFRLNLSQAEDETARPTLSLQITNRDNQDIAIWRIEDDADYRHEIDELLTPGDTINIVLKDLPASVLNNINPDDLPISLTLIAPERQEQNEPGAVSEEINYPGLPDLTLVYDTVRDVDIYIPRGRGLLRHASEMIE